MKSLFLNYIKQINESTAEDRYHKSKGLQPLEELSEYEALEKYSKDNSILISFRDEYYSKTKRIGLNLKSYEGTDKVTPNGIYCYPLKKIWSKFDHKKKFITIVNDKDGSNKFFIPPHVKEILVLKLKYENCLDFRKYNETSFNKDIVHLYNKYIEKKIDNTNQTVTQTGDTEENIKSIKDFFITEVKKIKIPYIRIPNSNSENNVYYSNLIWLAIIYICKEIKKSNSANVFTQIIKDMGYQSVYDIYGIIHTEVTTQIILLKQSAFELKDSIRVAEHNQQKGPPENHFFAAKKSKDTKIFKKIIDSLGKDYEKNINKIKSLLKNLNDVNYNPKGQEPLIHYFINYNKPEMVKELISYQKFNPNIKFKDYYINPIMFAVYKNQTEIVEILLSTNKLKNFKSIKNVFGKTALDMANDNKNEKIIELLTK